MIYFLFILLLHDATNLVVDFLVATVEICQVEILLIEGCFSNSFSNSKGWMDVVY